LKLGIISDIHCNRAALESAIERMGPVDELICLGDSINEYRFSNDVVSLLRERCAHMILGNHEETMLAMPRSRAYGKPGNDPALLGWLETLPTRKLLHYGSKKVLLVHSTPWSPRGDYVYPRSPLLKRFGEVDADFVLFGHTHMQIAERVGKVMVVNPGSAGEARDYRNGHQLSCAVIDVASDEVRLIDFPDPARPSA
jgi:putative phosphoesterase